MNKQPNVFVKLWRGDMPLWKAYWVFGALMMLPVNILVRMEERGAFSSDISGLIDLLSIGFLAYAIFWWIGTWKCARNSTTGWKIFGRTWMVLIGAIWIAAFAQGWNSYEPQVSHTKPQASHVEQPAQPVALQQYREVENDSPEIYRGWKAGHLPDGTIFAGIEPDANRSLIVVFTPESGCSAAAAIAKTYNSPPLAPMKVEMTVDIDESGWTVPDATLSRDGDGTATHAFIINDEFLLELANGNQVSIYTGLHGWERFDLTGSYKALNDAYKACQAEAQHASAKTYM